MRRIIQIFKKDAAHLWGAIFVFVATLVLFAITDPTYAAIADAQRGLMSFARLFYLLVPLSCWLLVILVIHEEKTIGHEQYWLTRPFSLRDLLTAKALFLVAFVHLPVFVCQAVVLSANGFSPVEHLGDLLAKQIFLAALLVLPMAALGAVTKSLGHAFLGGLLMSLVLAVTAGSLLAFAAGSGWGGLVWIRSSAVAVMAAIGALAVLWIQYTLRRTALSRWVLAAGVAMVALLWAAPPWQPAFAIQHWLSERQIDAHAVRISYAPRHDALPNAASAHTGGLVEIPIQVENIPAGMDVVADWVRVEVEGGGLKPWRSGWVAYWGLYREASGKRWLVAKIDPDYFEHVKDATVRVHGSMDLTLLVGSSNLASFGQCYFTGSPMVACLSPRPRALLARIAGEGNFTSLAPGTEVYAPYPTSPWFGPLQRYSPTNFGRNSQLMVEHAVAHIQRPFDLGPLRLADYQVPVD